METNFKIRAATLADLETIFYFICHLEEIHFDFESFSDRYKANMGRSDSVYLVSTSEADEVTGFISCQGQSLLHREGKIFEIQEVYVSRPNRSKGIGRALIAALEEKLRKTNAEILEASMHAKRTEARKFYFRLGFASTQVKLVKEM